MGSEKSKISSSLVEISHWRKIWTHFGNFLVVIKGCKSNRYILARLGNFKFAFKVGVEAMDDFRSDVPLELSFRL